LVTWSENSISILSDGGGGVLVIAFLLADITEVNLGATLDENICCDIALLQREDTRKAICFGSKALVLTLDIFIRIDEEAIIDNALLPFIYVLFFLFICDQLLS
jgi:hypothetical protein